MVNESVGAFEVEQVKKIATVAVACLVLSIGALSTQTARQVEQPSKSNIEVNIEYWANHAKMKYSLDYLKTRVNKTAYVFSGATPTGWDCSGLVVWLYKQFDLVLPHSADDLGHVGKRVSSPNVGDIVVMAYKGRKDFYHAGIYIGNNEVLNANRFYRTTVIESLDNYKTVQIRYVRVIEQANPNTFDSVIAKECWSEYNTEKTAILNCEERK